MYALREIPDMYVFSPIVVMLLLMYPDKIQQTQIRAHIIFQGQLLQT